MSDFGYPFIQAKNYTKGRLKPVELIVLHSMEAPLKVGTAENVAHYFATSAPASAHFCVDPQHVIQCVNIDDTAWQAKNANSNGCGIEHAGYARFTADDWATEDAKAMLELSAQLSANLCRRFSIPAVAAEFAAHDNPKVTQPGFCRHFEVPLHGSHSDPGQFFPFLEYIARVAEILKEAE